jgi:hypothetical protein
VWPFGRWNRFGLDPEAIFDWNDSAQRRNVQIFRDHIEREFGASGTELHNVAWLKPGRARNAVAVDERAV